MSGLSFFYEESSVEKIRETEPEAQYSDLPTAEEEYGFRVAGFPKTPLQFYQKEAMEACKPKVSNLLSQVAKLCIFRMIR